VGLLMWGTVSDKRTGLSFARDRVSSNKSWHNALLHLDTPLEVKQPEHEPQCCLPMYAKCMKLCLHSLCIASCFRTGKTIPLSFYYLAK
jgi:hypothetical protein